MHRITIKLPKYLRLFKCDLNCYKDLVLNRCKVQTRGFSNLTKNEQRTFDDLVLSRQEEARRSLLIQVHSVQSFNELHDYCSMFGPVSKSFHYVNEELNQILIEYETPEAADEAIRHCRYEYNENSPSIPVTSRFIWFSADKSKNKRKKTAPEHNALIHQSEVKQSKLNQMLLEANSIDEQMIILHQNTSISDLGTRLRFMAADQIRSAIVGMFPKAEVYPFGSSVNGFGKLGSDLDMIMKYTPLDLTKDASPRLVFHAKEARTDSRAQAQRDLQVISSIMSILPGISSVRSILHARVPIIKYFQTNLDLEVDLSADNLSGLYMSELLYLFGEIDARVRPLVFCIRRWAQEVKVTNSSPGHWLSNFGLTCLVIYFLQRLKCPILPTYNHLCKLSRPEDERKIDNMAISFLRDVKLLDFKTSNTDSLQELLMQFFEFYSKSNFNDKALSMHTGGVVNKPNHSPLYIINPLEPILNVTKNVNFEECERFRSSAGNAAWFLDTELNSKQKSGNAWGILGLFGSSSPKKIRPEMFYNPRMMDVNNLFGTLNDNDQPDSAAPSHIKFFNNNTKSTVDNIKRRTQKNIENNKVNAKNLQPTSRKRKS